MLCSAFWMVLNDAGHHIVKRKALSPTGFANPIYQRYDFCYEIMENKNQGRWLNVLQCYCNAKTENVVCALLRELL